MLCGAILMHTAVAVGQTDQERAAARSLATEGINAFNAGKNAEALDKLERAYQLASIPTIGLWSARALEKSGKLVEANERLIAVSRYKITHDDAGVFAQAKNDAEQLQDAIAPRIPQLKIDLVHADGLELTVDLDGTVLKNALLGVSFQVNPGKHLVTARAGSRQVQQPVLVNERDSARVPVDVAALHPPEGTAVAPAGAESSPAAEPAPQNGEPAPVDASASSGGMSGKRIAGFVVLGVGVGGLVTSAILGAKAIEQHSLYEERCPSGKCDAKYQDYYDTFQKNQTYALVAGGVGLVAVGAGLYLVISGGDSSSSRNSAYVRPFIGWQSVGAEGRF